MKIAILRLNAGDFGKVGYYNVQEIGMARVLKKLGHKPLVIYLDKNANEAYRIEKDNVLYLPCKSIGVHGIFDPEILKDYEIEGLILFADNQLWQKNVINWCKVNNVKCINYIGRIDTQVNKFKNKIFYKYLLIRNFKAFRTSINVTKTHGAKKAAQEMKIPVKNVIHIGLDLKELNYEESAKLDLRNELGLPLNKKILLYVGRLDENKNPLFSINLMKKLVMKSSEYHLVIIGKGVLKEKLLEHISYSNIEKNISYVESVPYEKMHKYYKACDCYINTCATEIFGMAILESMFYKCPVVAMAADGPKDIITHRENGLICNSFNLDEWVNNIESAIENNILIQNAHNKIKNSFNWDVSAKKFEELLLE